MTLILLPLSFHSVQPYTTTVKAASAKVFCAVLTAVDYAAALWLSGGESGGGSPHMPHGIAVVRRSSALKPLLLAARQDRTPIHNKDIAAQVSQDKDWGPSG